MGFGSEKKFANKSKEEMRELGKNYGKGLQLVNILRDEVEDEERGRRYLPGDRAGVVAKGPWIFGGWSDLLASGAGEAGAHGFGVAGFDWIKDHCLVREGFARGIGERCEGGSQGGEGVFVGGNVF